MSKNTKTKHASIQLQADSNKLHLIPTIVGTKKELTLSLEGQ